MKRLTAVLFMAACALCAQTTTVTPMYIAQPAAVSGPMGAALAAAFSPYLMVIVRSDDASQAGYLVTVEYVTGSGEQKTATQFVFAPRDPSGLVQSASAVFFTGRARIGTVTATPLVPRSAVVAEVQQ